VGSTGGRGQRGQAGENGEEVEHRVSRSETCSRNGDKVVLDIETFRPSLLKSLKN
jgi:hypothetical protein